MLVVVVVVVEDDDKGRMDSVEEDDGKGRVAQDTSIRCWSRRSCGTKDERKQGGKLVVLLIVASVLARKHATVLVGNRFVIDNMTK